MNSSGLTGDMSNNIGIVSDKDLLLDIDSMKKLVNGEPNQVNNAHLSTNMGIVDVVDDTLNKDVLIKNDNIRKLVKDATLAGKDEPNQINNVHLSTSFGIVEDIDNTLNRETVNTLNLVKDTITQISCEPHQINDEHIINEISVEDNSTKLVKDATLPGKDKPNKINNVHLSTSLGIVEDIDNTLNRETVNTINLVKDTMTQISCEPHQINDEHIINEISVEDNSTHFNSFNLNSVSSNEYNDIDGKNEKESINFLNINNDEHIINEKSVEDNSTNFNSFNLNSVSFNECNNLDGKTEKESIKEQLKALEKLKDNDYSPYADTKVELLGKLTDKHVCLQCKPLFSTDDQNEYERHCKVNHKGKQKLNCLYCCITLEARKMSNHVEFHFAEKYNIEQCQLCRGGINVKNRKNILYHMNEFHQSRNQCPFCKAEFMEVSDLYYHLTMSKGSLYQCNEMNCIVVSHNKDLYDKHLAESHHHPSLTKVTSYMTCKSLDSSSDRCCNLENDNKRLSKCSSRNLYKSYKVDNVINEQIDTVKYKLDYSPKVLRKICSYMSESDFIEIKNKMDQYATKYMAVGIYNNRKHFFCDVCQYKTEHSVSDIRKHILGVHCSISGTRMRECIQACKTDSNYNLLSDREIIVSINQSKIKSGKSHSLLEESEDENNTITQKINLKRSLTPSLDLSTSKRPKLAEIQPRFSDTALERFCQKSNYFSYYELMRAEMMKLCQNKGIYILVDNHWYLKCSGCNITIKKYYDLFKHFMVHHTNIPAHLREIARACSKTNKNYELLSDEELMKLNPK